MSFNSLTIQVITFTVLLFSIQTAFSEQQLDDQKHDDQSWFDDDFEARSLAVNEGDLKFIPPVLDKPILHSDVRLRIDDSSMRDGWVKLAQCYENIHPVSETEIIYQYQQIRDLKAVSIKSIGQVKVEGQVIQLNQVTADAELCVTAEINVFDRPKQEEGQSPLYRLAHGPYHLRFFDGYYPFHLTLSIEYPSELIRTKTISPLAEPLFEIIDTDGVISVDTWFEGELLIQVEWERR